MELTELLQLAVEKKASDIFLKVDNAPAFRINGEIVPLDMEPLTAYDVKDYAEEIADDDQMASFEKRPELDTALALPGIARFRVNIYQQRGTIGIVLRIIPFDLFTLDELKQPPVLKKISMQPQGLVLVTGPTGSGKSTTLAAMIDYINKNRRAHIVTVEDPIEFVHRDQKSIVSQREVGVDTNEFMDALRAVLRQSPDVILIGELRDQETMGVCLQAAETGHLVFSTLHTPNAAETLERIINMFPPHDKPAVCERLGKSLRGVISQKLVARADGKGRLCASEIMIVTPTIAQYIEEGRTREIYAAIVQDGKDGHWGMQSCNQALDRFYKAGLITEEMALRNAGNVTELRQMMRRKEEAPVRGQEDELARKAFRQRQQQLAAAQRQRQGQRPPSQGQGAPSRPPSQGGGTGQEG